MKQNYKHNHIIDYLFPVVLFFIFTLSALTVLLLAANVYRSTVEHSALTDTSRTSLSYVAEKIHQADANDAVSLGTFDGQDALVLQQTFDNVTYYTYIYTYEHELKEIFLKDGAKASASGGHTILKVEDFSMEELSENLFRFQCTDAEGEQASIIAGVHSEIKK